MSKAKAKHTSVRYWCCWLILHLHLQLHQRAMITSGRLRRTLTPPRSPACSMWRNQCGKKERKAHPAHVWPAALLMRKSWSSNSQRHIPLHPLRSTSTPTWNFDRLYLLAFHENPNCNVHSGTVIYSLSLTCTYDSDFHIFHVSCFRLIYAVMVSTHTETFVISH